MPQFVVIEDNFTLVPPSFASQYFVTFVEPKMGIKQLHWFAFYYYIFIITVRPNQQLNS